MIFKNAFIDRNILTNGRLTNELKQALRSAKVRLYLDTILIDETIKYGIHNFEKAKEEIKFLLDISCERIFDHVPNIIYKELNNKKRDSKYQFLSCAEEKTIRKNLIKASNFKTNQVLNMLNEENLNKGKYKNSLLSLHDKVRELNPGNYVQKAKNILFDDYYAQYEKDTLKMLLDDIVKDKIKAKKIFDDWNDIQDRFPYTKLFLRGDIYSHYHQMIKQPVTAHFKIEPNLYADLLQIILMKDIDILISEDTNFMAQAFSKIWEDTDKRIMTIAEFLAFCDS